LCYAKFAPVALQCGDFAARRHPRSEPLGTKPEFEFSDFRRRSPAYDAARPFIHDGTGFKQNLPDA
jgi:hypothetical protein